MQKLSVSLQQGVSASAGNHTAVCEPMIVKHEWSARCLTANVNVTPVLNWLVVETSALHENIPRIKMSWTLRLADATQRRQTTKNEMSSFAEANRLVWSSTEHL